MMLRRTVRDHVSADAIVDHVETEASLFWVYGSFVLEVWTAKYIPNHERPRVRDMISRRFRAQLRHMVWKRVAQPETSTHTTT
eukprot:795356-Rhodomonas_salina.1